MFEGVPTYPDAEDFGKYDKHQVNIFILPTAIRALQAYGSEIIEKYNLTL